MISVSVSDGSIRSAWRYGPQRDPATVVRGRLPGSGTKVPKLSLDESVPASALPVTAEAGTESVDSPGLRAALVLLLLLIVLSTSNSFGLLSEMSISVAS